MKNAVATSLVLACFLAAGTATARAEPAIYREGILEIPQGITVDAGGDRSYSKVRLRSEADGSLRIVQAQPRNLVMLDERRSTSTPMARLQSISAEATVVKGDIHAVYVTVLKSFQCVEVNPVKVVRHGKDFFMSVTERPVPENVRCLPATQPCVMVAAIDTAQLEPGKYNTWAHGHGITFTVLAP